MVVDTQVQIIECGTGFKYTNGSIRVLISVDSTPVWRSSATRADIFVESGYDFAAVGKGKNWATWFVLDGGDDVAPLRAMDLVGQLTEQVRKVQNKTHLHHDGQASRFNCFITGDGKGMQATNFKEGCRCWVCPHKYDDLAYLKVQSTVDAYVRAGSFLGCIPPDRRVGDYAHCAGRVVNAILAEHDCVTL